MKKNIQKNQPRSFDNSNLLRQFKALNKRQHQASFATRKTYRQSTRSILHYCYQTFNIQKIENIKDKHIRSYIESQEDKSVSCLKKELSGFRYYVDMLDRDGKECHFHAFAFFESDRLRVGHDCHLSLRYGDDLAVIMQTGGKGQIGICVIAVHSGVPFR